MARGYAHKTSDFSATLDSYYLQARIYPPESNERKRILDKAFSDHAALCYSIAEQMANYMKFEDIFGFYWMAMVEAVDSWVPTISKANTHTRSVCIKIIKDYAYKHHTRGAVRVPMRSKKYSGGSIDDVIESILEISE